MSELKPCPFCGGDAEILSTGNYWKKTFYRIYCKKSCCVQGSFYPSKIIAAEEWNKRAERREE